VVRHDASDSHTDGVSQDRPNGGMGVQVFPPVGQSAATR
jgi:hypothetical protein